LYAQATAARGGGHYGGSGYAGGYQSRYGAQQPGGRAPMQAAGAKAGGVQGFSSMYGAPQAQQASSGYARPAAGAGGIREAPTRQQGYGGTMAGRSTIGSSSYGGSKTSAAPRTSSYARPAPAPAGGSYGGGRNTGSRYY
jgi:hypothetical protein